MSDITTTAGTAINALHAEATQHAERAIDCARRAGLLLQQVKDELRHGEFLPWLAEHCSVSPRQAQRYMAAAKGKPLALRSVGKCDTVSHLARRESAFEPIADACMFTHDGSADYFVEQSTTPDHYFVSAVALKGDDDAVMDYLRRPIRGDYAELVLQHFGLAEPHSAAWRIVRRVRVGECLGVPQ